MESLARFQRDIFKTTTRNFEKKALRLFQIQSKQNVVYKEYLKQLDRHHATIHKLTDIPFLPVEFFKTQIVKTGDWKERTIFKSSGTTKTGRSQHFIQNLNLYYKLSLNIAEKYFGSLKKLKILALLPSYLEQGDSSLIAMMNYFISKASTESGFQLQSTQQLVRRMLMSNERILLFGVSYALLDLSENFEIDLSDHIVVETGGMKGRQKEIIRDELHMRLRSAFKCDTIHTEYGMTELLSQAYGADGSLCFPAWCKPLIRDINDPFDLKEEGFGALNVIDLANSHSCSFVETKDLVQLRKNGQFEVVGRMDNSEMRGCSLLL